jgi:hypothetical protein
MNPSMHDAEALAHLSLQEPICFPWDGIVPFCRSQGWDYLPMIGYGSLISPSSAARTLKSTHSIERVEVMAFGFRRLFNYRMSERSLERWGEPMSSINAAALNLLPTWNAQDTFNGTLLKVSFDDLEELRERERDYDLSQTVCRTWQQTNEPMRTAFVLTSPSANLEISSIMPVPGYLELCRGACREISEEFLHYFDRHTFLTDGKTSLEEWLTVDQQV